MPNKVLLEKIKNKKAKVGVIGLGYVGLPLAVEFSKSGFFTYGFDIDPKKIISLKRGKSYIQYISGDTIRNGYFHPTNSFKKLETADCIIICVPTPVTETKEPDLSFIVNTVETIARYLRKNHLIILESTTYPGTTDDVVKPILEKTGLKAGEDFYLAYSPEREDPGNKNFSIRNTPKVVGGIDRTSTELASTLYRQLIEKVVVVSSAKVAEAVKMLENTFRAVNIALVNELKMLFDKLGIDIWEVIEASKTKPFGYMPFYPGPGWGGHCLTGKEFIFIKKDGGLESIRIEELYQRYKKDVFSINDVNVIAPKGLEILSFNLEKEQAEYKKVRAITCRRHKGIIQFMTEDNRQIEVTDLHPIVVCNGDICLKFAKDIIHGDYFIINHSLPNPVERPPVLNLVEYLKSEKISSKIRIKPKDLILKDYAEYIKPYLKKHTLDYNYRDYWRGNFLPFNVFLELITCERGRVPFKEANILLCTGSGSSITEIPAVFKITPTLCRLIGYYLSEGCITRDESSRVRFSFNKKEKELINDVIMILGQLGIKYSLYNDKKSATTHIKVSSEIFSFLLEKVLGCGINSYNMKIPSILFSLRDVYKEALLKGLFRGDGGVDFASGRRPYFKNGKTYNHFFNNATVNYYTVNPHLFQQVILLLQNIGVIPYFKKRYGLLNIGGHNQLEKMLPFFEGEKSERIKTYFENCRKIIPNKLFKRDGNFLLTKVKGIKNINTEQEVYSLEVEDNHTFISSYGLIIHNCIPVDPFYLSWLGRKNDFIAKFIELAGEINIKMPEYVLEKIISGLNTRKKPLKGARILILGLSYKKDIGDPRESPSFKIIELLENKGSIVDYNDPYIPKTSPMRHFNIRKESVDLTPNIIRRYDCVVIITDHSVYEYGMILKNARLVVDTRNAMKAVAKNVIKA